VQERPSGPMLFVTPRRSIAAEAASYNEAATH
jgi:hypothetical protein